MAAKRILGLGQPFPDIHLFIGFPYLHDFNFDPEIGDGSPENAKTVYDMFLEAEDEEQRRAAHKNIAGWYSFDEPPVPLVVKAGLSYEAVIQQSYTNSVAWFDSWIANKGDATRIWGPVHYANRFFFHPQPYGPALAETGHQLYMADIYTTRFVGDMTQKVVKAAGPRSPIIWLAAHQWDEQVFLEYGFWEAIVHGAKGIIWFPTVQGVTATFNTPSPCNGCLYDGGHNGEPKFGKPLGQRIEDMIHSFRSWGVQDAILQGTPPGARFQPLNTVWTQDWPAGHDEIPRPEDAQPYPSTLDYDLNGRIFRVARNKWIVVVVNDGNDALAPGHSGYARFQITDLPRSLFGAWSVQLIDGNDTEPFRWSIRRGITSTRITVDDVYLNLRGYRIFRIEGP